MCGIIGVLNYGSNEDENRESALYLTSTLVEFTEPRGKDATGVAALFDDGNFVCQKGAISASKFVARFGKEPTDFNGFLSVLRLREEPLRTVIGHCRKKSVGRSANNANNHPIKAGNIVGVHNGTLKNDDIIFEKLKCARDGQVDSEAIFRLFDHYTKNGKEPFTMEMVEEVIKRLEGSFSILTFNANNPNQVIAARDQRPAEFCFIKPLKLMLVASEKKFIENSIWNYNKLAYHFNMNGFIQLKYGDVEYSTLKDDGAAIFYLNREIKEDTKIEDLYEAKDMPKSVNRIWKTPVQTYNYGNTYGNNYRQNNYANRNNTNTTQTNVNSNVNTNKTNVSTDKKEDSNDKAPTDFVGRVWSATIHKFVKTQSPARPVLNVGKSHTVVDTEKKVIMSLSEAAKENEEDNIVTTENFSDIDETNLEDKYKELTVSGKSVENCKDSCFVPISSIEAVRSNNSKVTEEKEEREEENILPKKGQNVLLLEHIKKGAKKGKDTMSDEMNLHKESNEALSEFEKFETADEVAELCNTDRNSLESLPVQFLANRVVRHVFNKIFALGWLSKKKDVYDSGINSHKYIIALKNVAYALDKLIEHRSGAPIDHNDVKKVINELGICNKTEMEHISSLFSKGDLLNNKNIKHIVNHYIQSVSENER
jgi:hypothetical protein